MLARRQNLRECSICNPTFTGFEKTSSYGRFRLIIFFSAFQWSQSIGKPSMTPVSFVKTNRIYDGVEAEINRIYDGVEAETRKSQASFQII